MRAHIFFNDDVINKLDRFIELNNRKSRSEVVNKAVEFYIDYNNNKNPGEFLSREFKIALTKSMDTIEKKLGNKFVTLINDTAIQLGIVQQILKSITNIQEEEIRTYKKSSPQVKLKKKKFFIKK